MESAVNTSVDTRLENAKRKSRDKGWTIGQHKLKVYVLYSSQAVLAR